MGESQDNVRSVTEGDARAGRASLVNINRRLRDDWGRVRGHLAPNVSAVLLSDVYKILPLISKTKFSYLVPILFL